MTESKFRAMRFLVLVTTHNRSDGLRDLLEILTKASSSSLKFLVAIGNSGSFPTDLSDFSELDVREYRLPAKSFWAKGMEILREIHADWDDAVIWANDDIVMTKETLESALYRSYQSRAIHFGIFVDGSGRVTYGGWRRSGPIRVVPDLETSVGSKSDFCNGNFVVIPKGVPRSIPRFPKGFNHGFADFALGSIATKNNVNLESLGIVGICAKQTGLLHSQELGLARRVNAFFSPKGIQFLGLLRWRILERGPVLGALDSFLIFCSALASISLSGRPENRIPSQPNTSK
jgi:hypothetical protein